MFVITAPSQEVWFSYKVTSYGWLISNYFPTAHVGNQTEVDTHILIFQSFKHVAFFFFTLFLAESITVIETCYINRAVLGPLFSHFQVDNYFQDGIRYK